MNIIEFVNQEMLVAKRDMEMMPSWYYGYAYRDILRNRSVFAVMPLNWLIRWSRQLERWWNIFRGLPPQYELIKSSDMHKAYGEEYRRGFEDGNFVMDSKVQAAYQRGYDEALAFFAKTFYSDASVESKESDAQ